MRNQDAFRGCIVGGAAGDALGYAVEFEDEDEIFGRYGAGGITEYELDRGKALFSDDTQMTLFTAAGLLCSGSPGNIFPMDRYVKGQREACLQWFRTQSGSFAPGEEGRDVWLMQVRELFSPRAPGNACMMALRAGGLGTPEAPANHSKGCGGVMRVAPVGLYFNDRGVAPEWVCELGARAAAVTHGHPLGWMPAGALSQIIHEVSQDGTDLETAAGHAMKTLAGLWPEESERLVLEKLVERAVNLSHGKGSDLEAIHALGEGWIGEEALAIALYCALRYPGDIGRALTAAVNHQGDSDSTGAICGNIGRPFRHSCQVHAQPGAGGCPAGGGGRPVRGRCRSRGRRRGKAASPVSGRLVKRGHARAA